MLNHQNTAFLSFLSPSQHPISLMLSPSLMLRIKVRRLSFGSIRQQNVDLPRTSQILLIEISAIQALFKLIPLVKSEMPFFDVFFFSYFLKNERSSQSLLDCVIWHVAKVQKTRRCTDKLLTCSCLSYDHVLTAIFQRSNFKCFATLLKPISLESLNPKTTSQVLCLHSLISNTDKSEFAVIPEVKDKVSKSCFYLTVTFLHLI